MEKRVKSENLQSVQELRSELRQWQSGFRLMFDEMSFIDHLLNSYVFQPNTPNLFERLTDYLDRLKTIKRRALKIGNALRKHESDLGGVMEGVEGESDGACRQEHSGLRTKVETCLKDFGKLKTEIFNYAGSILKRRKPD